VASGSRIHAASGAQLTDERFGVMNSRLAITRITVRRARSKAELEPGGTLVDVTC